MKEIARSAIVEHAAAQMFALVDDIEAYPRFLPWCVEAKVDETGARKRASLTAAMAGIRQSFTTENENQPDRAINMRLVKGPFPLFPPEWPSTPLGKNPGRVQFDLRYQFASRT